MVYRAPLPPYVMLKATCYYEEEKTTPKNAFLIRSQDLGALLWCVPEKEMDLHSVERGSTKEVSKDHRIRRLWIDSREHKRLSAVWVITCRF
ncbi:hypothetical protein TNIN_435711 [Trichonephila inaurata madagascariensis]|uniref:Uncharacterized protein n=1 Tax=Trichonephila inaurata madagascariensis TaxID=2747483 RepID=A0A8X6I726_9ARAC|nr:hypothetical protein TNIN_435711 [Trichonephila inaurata madagascariensis]